MPRRKSARCLGDGGLGGRYVPNRTTDSPQLVVTAVPIAPVSNLAEFPGGPTAADRLLHQSERYEYPQLLGPQLQVSGQATSLTRRDDISFTFVQRASCIEGSFRFDSP
jgi:hypothetical protein